MPKPQFAIIECEGLKKTYHWCSLAEFLPDNKTVVGFAHCRADEPLLLAHWDAESGKKLKVVDAMSASHAETWVSPDRRTMAIATLSYEASSESEPYAPLKAIGKTYIVDTVTLKIRVALPYAAPEAVFSRNGELMAVKDRDRTIHVIELQTNREVASRKTGDFQWLVAFGNDPEELLFIEHGTLSTWNHRTGKVRKGPEFRGSKHVVSPDGRNLVYCRVTSGEFTPVVADTTSWKPKKTRFCGHVRHFSLSPDATKLAIAASNMLVVWDLVENEPWLKWKKTHYYDIRHAAFSPDGQRIACIMNEGRVHIFDFRAGAKDQVIARPKPKRGELQCVKMVGPDDEMDRVEGAEPLNPLPVACPVCKRLDLDFVQSPYVLGSKIASPVDFAPAVAGNLLVRETMKRVLEVAAPGLCKFHPTIARKTKEPTPWLLAVPQHTQVTADPSAKKCRKCRQPQQWEDSDTTHSPISKHEIFKAANEWDDDRRDLYFSVRLETLVKKLGLRGMVRYAVCRDEPAAEDLAWVEEKLRLLKHAGPTPAAAAKSGAMKRWFEDYLKKNAKKNPAACDFAAFEKKHGIKLPESYKAFISRVGTKTYKDVDGEEGFCVHIVSPKQLAVEQCCERGAEEDEAFKGVRFATTDHGDAFYFAVSGKGSDYEVRKNDHEVESYEPYAANFAEAVKRFAGA